MIVGRVALRSMGVSERTPLSDTLGVRICYI